MMNDSANDAPKHMDHSFRQWADASTRAWKNLHGGPSTHHLTVPRIAPPDVSDFLRDYVEPSRPAILEGLTKDWNIRRNWTIESLANRFGERNITVARAPGGALAQHEETGIPSCTMRFGDFVTMLRAERHPELYVTASLERAFPELRDELDLPPYCRDARWRRSRMFLGAPNTFAPLHRDLANNLFVQLVGRKRFLLYHRDDTPWLYSHSFFSGIPNFSRFNPFDPDFKAFPHAQHVRPLDVTLEEGDVLFLPSLWWHCVHGLDLSLSVSIWWAHGPLEWLVRAAETWKNLRDIEL